MRKIAFLSLFVIGLALSGCQSQSNPLPENTEGSVISDVSEKQTSGDESDGTEDAADVNVKAQETQVVSGGASYDRITSGGNYTYTGTVKKPIIIDSEEAVEITLDQVSMSMDSICIFAVNGDVTLNVKGENSLENKTSDYFPYQDEKIDAVIYAKDDLLIKGSGTLRIHSEMHGIVCKDALTLNAKVDVTSEKTAVRGKKGIEVTDAGLTLDAGTDGLKSDGDDGTIAIKNSDIQVSAGDDAIHANYQLTVYDGVLKLSGKECLEAVLVAIKGGTIEIEASDDGINAAQKVQGITPEVNISGGDIKIVMGAGDTDGIDSNGNLVISGGTIDITANSPFDYDGQGSFTGGTVYVNGQQVTTLPNQMGGFRGNGREGRNGRRGGRDRWSDMGENV